MGVLRWFVLAGVHVCFLYSAVKCATPSVAGCPRYVEEGGTLTCTCTKGDCTSSDVTLSWRDHDPASPTLIQTDVQTQDNGSPFTCQMVCGGETSTVTYTLQVGCAPRLPERVSSDTDKCPSTITEDGFDLLVVANPSPSLDDVTVTYLGDTLDKDIFTLFTIHQHSISLYETKFEVRVTDFTEMPDGEYRLSVSNTLGKFQCSFNRAKTAVKCATPSVAGCPRYVEEGGTLICTCTKGDCTSSDVTLSWRDHDPTSPTLVQTDVQRQDNGSPFTCQMVCGGETSTVTHTLQVGYGPSADNTSILGNTTVIADGTRLLNLTCLATEVNPAPSYAWLDSVCRDHYQGSSCSVIPQPSQDGTIVRCRATDRFRDTPVTAVTEAKLDLLFPPEKAPVISGYTPGQIVKTGDILTCTVTDGKPLVKYVTFSCSNPDHQDRDDVTEGGSVSSSVTIDTSNVSKDNDTMTCYCSGYWAPQPDLYTLHTNVSFYTEYNASLTNFTVNGRADNILTLNESDHVTVTLECRAYGRPAPRVYVMKNKTEEKASNGVPGMLEFSQNITYTMSPAECEHTGNYTAVVNDGSIDTGERTVQIVVYCAPQLPKRVSSDTDKCPSTITEDGFDLLVVANPSPSPDDVTVTYLDDTLDKDILTLLTIHQHPISLYEIKLRVRVTDFTELPGGEYRLSVSNTLGKFQCSFNRAKTEASSTAPVGAVIGGVVGAIVVLAVVIAGVIFWMKRYQRYEKPQPRRTDESSPYTELQPPPFSNSEQELTVNYANTEPRPDLSQPEDPDSYVNVDTRQNTYEHIQPGRESVQNVYTTLQTS